MDMEELRKALKLEDDESIVLTHECRIDFATGTKKTIVFDENEKPAVTEISPILLND